MEGSDKTAGVDPIPVALPPAPASQHKVLLALPWQKQTNPMTAFAVMNLVDRRRTAVMLDFGDAFVAHSRNNCATQFLATSMEWMLMVDDDCIPVFSNAKWWKAYCGADVPDLFANRNALDRLLSHGKTLIGGYYHGRHARGKGMYCEACNVPAEAAFLKRGPHDIIKPTRWVATGCLLIHRSVFEDIEKKFPRLSRERNSGKGQWFATSEHTAMDWIDRARKELSCGQMTGEKAYKVASMLETASAEAKANSSLGMGEDVQLCVRAKEAGHQPFVDLGCLVGHVGSRTYGFWNVE